MGVQLTTLAELVGMLKRQGVDPKQVLDAVSATAMWNPHLTRDAESMLSGNFETKFPVKLLEKDLGYTVKTAGGDAAVPTVSAALPRDNRKTYTKLTHFTRICSTLP
jgi:3-hydroxyisobutyrate dehydrogenase-like beta-hydroxyacid dehydrogenase